MKILVAKEKHGDRYFDASTNEKLALACIYLLKERMEENGYFGYEPEKPKGDDILTEEQICQLPERLRASEISRLNSYQRAMDTYEDEMLWYNEVKRVVETKSTEMATTCKGKYPLAYELLYSREDYEYEQICIEELESVE